ncbi:hypothetical protein [Actinoallomurus rhizosphaericola]|nr:hypothetical protein [Actinoallomurus rhizosphaericola]
MKPMGGRGGAWCRAKYGHHASIVDHLQEQGLRAATLEVHPA